MVEAIPIQVAVRVRPFNQREINECASSYLNYYVQQNQIGVSDKMFAFDCVFDPSTSQDAVYDVCAAPLLEQLFKGYNCTVLAYGQTGSGKTYTMGTDVTTESMDSENRGIISRMVEAIFNQVKAAAMPDLFSVTVSMLEIYEDRVLDLLCTSKESLQIRELKGSVYVQGLSCQKVNNLAETMRELEKGCQLRTKGGTAMNDKSSRSHAIFTLTIEKLPKDEEDGNFKSKLHLVDLAGSERLKKTLSEGERMREGIKINEGLLGLGKVISALADSTTGVKHIPYRDSKITRLLQDSLGGNSYTTMIACISPADSSAEETMSTLRYADRAKKIKNKPVVNLDASSAIIQGLREELAAVRHQLVLAHGGDMSIESRSALGLLETRRQELQQRYDNLEKDYERTKRCLHETVLENSVIAERLCAVEAIKDVVLEKFKQIGEYLVSKTEIPEDFKDLLNLCEVPTSDVQQEDEGKIECSEKCDDDIEGDEITDEQAYQNAQRQIVLSRDLTNLLKQIREKELAVELTLASNQNMEKMKAAHAAELEEIHKKLEDLEKEKAALLAKAKTASNQQKLSEDRRRRLQELEKELSLYKRRQSELKRLQKEKLELEEKQKRLSEELLELKRTRVKLARQIKQEEIKFRTMKLKADREIGQLKTRERKRELELARQKQLSTQQMAILRRKCEEANACSRRLQQQLNQREAVRSAHHGPNLSEDQIITSLEEDVSLAFAAAEAKVHCTILIEQRKTLSQQMNRLKLHLEQLKEEPSVKRRTGSDHSTLSNDAEIRETEEAIRHLKEEIELRGSELKDLQAKCLKADPDSRGEQPWLFIRSLSQAKSALKRVFDMAVSERRLAFEKEIAVDELKRSVENQNRENSETSESLQRKLAHANELLYKLQETLAEKERKYMQREKALLSGWSAMADGRSDVQLEVLEELKTMRDNTIKVNELRRIVKHQKKEIERLKRRCTSRRSLSESAIGRAEMPPLEKQIHRKGSHRHHTAVEQKSTRNAKVITSSKTLHKPVQHYGAAARFELSDEEENVVEYDDTKDESYLPTPVKRGRSRGCSRSSSLKEVCQFHGRKKATSLAKASYNLPIIEGTEKDENKMEIDGQTDLSQCNTTFTVDTKTPITLVKPVPDSILSRERRKILDSLFDDIN